MSDERLNIIDKVLAYVSSPFRLFAMVLMAVLTFAGYFVYTNPSKEEQERIVSILDKFANLTSSISEGLPKEIELRKKQYEYYRDMLLSFPK